MEKYSITFLKRQRIVILKNSYDSAEMASHCLDDVIILRNTLFF